MILVPAFPWVWWINQERIADLPDGRAYDEHVAIWKDRLNDGHAGPDRRVLARLAYQQAMDRLTGLESKAVGLLTVIGIVAAGGFAACSGETPAPAVAIAGLAYASFAGVACAMILVPGPRHALVLDDVLSETAGYAEMAAAARMVEPIAARTSNLLTSATYDLVRSFLLIAAALGVLVSS